MRSFRFFCETLHGERARLDAIQSRHLARVLRLRVGDQVQLFDGQGLLAEAVIERLDREHTVVRVVNQIQISPKTTGRVILAVSIAKGERFDWMIEKCTELGADHIAAVHYEHTVKMGKESALERYKKIALAAAKQCGRLHLPTLTGPASLERTLADLHTRYPDAQLLYGDAEGQRLLSAGGSDSRPDSIICIGPEGGFSDAERQFFGEAEAWPVCVNPNILRIETAAIAFAAVFAVDLPPENPRS
jgi:16S rRNA (uracil1498-N3)-methyltransferase